MRITDPAIPFEFNREVEAPPGGNLEFVEGAEEVLPSDFVDGVIACLTFNDPLLTPVNAAGRSYFLSLPEEIDHYDALQISGGGYVVSDSVNGSPKGATGHLGGGQQPNVIQPLSADIKPYESAGTSYIDDDGSLQTVFSKGILGTYSERQGGLKVTNTNDVWSRLQPESGELLVPRVIAKFAYDLPDGEGGAQTAVLMLVPNNGLRLDHDLQKAYIEIVGSLDRGMAQQRAREVFREEMPAKMRSLGFGLAKVHDLGYSHNQTHLGNMATVESEDGALMPFIADWDTSRRPGEKIRLLAQTGDFAQTVISLMRWFNGINIMYNDPAYWGNAKALANSVLHGYASYYNHDNPESLRIPAGEMMKYVDVLRGPEDMLEFFGKVVASAKAAC